MNKMDRFKELSNDIIKTLSTVYDDNKVLESFSDIMFLANALIEKGYFKVQENPIGLTEKEQGAWVAGYKVGFKDGVVASGVQAKQALEKIKTELIGEEQK